MLTKRSFLSGIGAASAARVLIGSPNFAHATEGESTLKLSLHPETLVLPSGGKTIDIARLTAPGAVPVAHLHSGAPCRLSIRNDLHGPASLRWVGLRGWGSLDDPEAGKLKGIAAGETRSLVTARLDPGTSLIRAAPAASGDLQGATFAVAMDEAEPPAIDRDFAVLVADRLFAADGTERYGSTPPPDAKGSVLLVNGRAAPLDLEAPPHARVRLRLVNASARRIMLIAVEGAASSLIAIDGQPSAMFPPAHSTIPVGPDARYDLLFDMPDTANAVVSLILKPSEILGGTLEAERTLVRFSAHGDPVPARPPAAPLPANPALPVRIPLETAKRADLSIAGTIGGKSPPSGWSVNGVPGDKALKPVLTVRRGAAVTLGLINTTATTVPLRIAGHAVRLLHPLDDGWSPYWRDTLLLPPASRNHVAFVADTPGRWAIDSSYDDLTLAGLSCFFDVTPS